MDLRERKTLASIKQAFLALRAQKSLERITVRELTERAQIGKATFYLHYHSVYDLSESLQREAVDEIVSAIAEPESYLTAPDRVTRQLFAEFRKRADLVDVLFSGEQAAVLAQSIEVALRERIGEAFPGLLDDVRTSALLTFMVQGGFYAYRAARQADRERFGASASRADQPVDVREREAVEAVAEASCTVTALMREGKSVTSETSEA